MSTWLALALPALHLQLAQRAFDPALARTLALAVVDGPAQRSTVRYCSAAAQAAGVQPGMKLAAAQALAGALLSVEYAPARETEALQELACWAYQFSPAIERFTAPGCSGVVLETGASERLFGGPRALRQRITRGLHRLGYQASDASAPTLAAARILATARAGGHTLTDVADLHALPAALGALPLSILDWEPATLQTLHTLGVDTIGEVLALPRDAFARRFGPQRLLELDRLLGLQPTPQASFIPPERFLARIELPADLSEVERLLVPLQRLLQSLEGFLRGRGMGATALLLRAWHNPRRAVPTEPTRVALALAVAERDPQRLLRLYTERLARVRLPEPAIVLELELAGMAPWVATSTSFLPPAPQDGTQGIDALQLAQTLHARLGSEGVFQLQSVSDHRPEHAYRQLPLGPGTPQAAPVAPTPAQRPLLILPTPLPLPTPRQAEGESRQDPQPTSPSTTLPRYAGPLELLAGPERIEAGWWDLATPGRTSVHRDYFVARNRQGQTLWIYREMAAPQRWFLQGYFA